MDILNNINVKDIKDIDDFVKTIYPYLKDMGVFGASMQYGKKLITKTYDIIKGLPKRHYYDIGEIFNEVEKANINIGDIIETSGYLLKYGQVFKPYTHVNSMFSNLKKGKDRVIYKNGRKIIQASMLMSSKPLEPPIQKIPIYNNIGCAFLYDSRFKGFMHELNNNKEEQKETPLIIDNFSKPIMILYDISKHEKFINKEINIKGRIIKLPLELTGTLNGLFDKTIQEICSNFFRPYNENINFICLSLLDSEYVREISEINDIYSIKAPIYIEAQAEGLSSFSPNEAQNLIEDILPNLPQRLDPQFPFKVGTFTNNIGTPFLSINNINVIYREPEILGFYCETELFEPAKFRNNLNEFTIFVNNFNLDYQNITKKLLGEKKDLKLNFLFDYEKQYLFDKRGVLNSNTAKSLYELDESSRYIQNWLKRDNSYL